MDETTQGGPDGPEPRPTGDDPGRGASGGRRTAVVTLSLVVVAIVAVVVAFAVRGGDGPVSAPGADDEITDGGTSATDADGADTDGADTDGADTDGADTDGAGGGADAGGGGDDDGADDDVTDTDGAGADDGGTGGSDDGAGTSAPLDPDVAAAEAQDTLTRFLALADAAYAAPDEEVDLDGTATGAAADEVDGVVTEYRTSGLVQRGEVEVVEVSADVDVDASPPTVELGACLDASEVSILDEDGEEVGPATEGARSRHLYGVQLGDDGWQVVTHDFPDDADC